MTREEAIEYAEKKAYNDFYQLETGYLNSGLYQIKAREYDFLRVAISALKWQGNLATNLQPEASFSCKWISVKERLPSNPNERVLVMVDGDSVNGTPKMDTDRYADRYNPERWVRYGKHVTHWMPLPEPPKED